MYLSQYGYLGPARANSSQLMDENSYKRAIEDFQSFAGIEVTGKYELNITYQTVLTKGSHLFIYLSANCGHVFVLSKPLLT